MNEAIILAAIAQIEVGLAALEHAHTQARSQEPTDEADAYKNWRSAEILQSILQDISMYKDVMGIDS